MLISLVASKIERNEKSTVSHHPFNIKPLTEANELKQICDSHMKIHNMQTEELFVQSSTDDESL